MTPTTGGLRRVLVFASDIEGLTLPSTYTPTREGVSWVRSISLIFSKGVCQSLAFTPEFCIRKGLPSNGSGSIPWHQILIVFGKRILFKKSAAGNWIIIVMLHYCMENISGI
jgi:hypothetical protein